MQFWADWNLTDPLTFAPYNFVRRSERMADEIRDPNDRKSKERFRILWLEARIGDMYEALKSHGLAIYGNSFHVSYTVFTSLRPFYVKDATRSTCMCVYHLRWREMADGLLTYRKTLKQTGVATCSCNAPVNETWLRKQLICQREDVNNSYDNVKCMLQRCPECKDLKKLTAGPGSLCAEERRDHAAASGGALKVKFESYEKITYTTKDGQTKDKKDFIAAELPYSEFEAKLKEYWPKFILHHNDAKWQDDDFASLMRRLERDCVGAVIDFAENYSHEPRFEHQSKYFSQVQSTIVPVVLMFRVEDLTNISEEEHAKLIALYGEERNTWEPEANLLTAEVQAEAAKVREAGLPRTAAGLQKAVVVTLKAVLAARGLDTSGQKAQLVARLLSVLQGE